MITCRWIFTAFAVAAAGALAAPGALASTLDRDYRMGDDLSEGASPNAPVTSTFDSQGVSGQQQLIDLTAVNSPTYRSINALGRPDGGTGLAIEFDATQQEYLHGENLNWPEASASSIGQGGTLNYDGIVDRGFQFWVRPTSTATQSMVIDSNDHGARISSGKFSMRYANVDYDSNLSVVPNTWYHVMVVRPQSAANGSRMFVDGRAVAAAPGDYGSDPAHLVVGADTGGDAMNFTGGTDEFFSGIIDDLEMFVIGTSTASAGNPAVNWGSFNFATENDYAADILTGVPGDLDHSGTLTQADKNAFIDGWMFPNVINGIQVGDLESFEQGDLNFDGITNIFDLAIMQGALSGAGMGAITSNDLLGIPEPATLALLLWTTIAATAWRRPRRHFPR